MEVHPERGDSNYEKGTTTSNCNIYAVSQISYIILFGKYIDARTQKAFTR